MSGISTQAGIFSGINSGQIIEQLLAIEARPKLQVQKRIAQLQAQQAGYLDLNSKLGALKSAAEAFRTQKIFQKKSATSSNKDVLSATADATAAPGSYTFMVDRLVSSQQVLSRGFSNRDVSGVGLTSATFETARARLDRTVNLSDLNDGQGVSRGKITITDSGGRSATVDLSRAITVDDVLEAINTNGTAQVTASVKDGKFVLKDNANGNVTVGNFGTSTTATSLGIAGTASGTLTGSVVYGLNANTSTASLNDGRGVGRKQVIGEGIYDFRIVVNDGGTNTNVNVNIGDVYGPGAVKLRSAVTTVGGVVERINEALAAMDVTDMQAEIDKTNGRLVIRDLAGGRTISVEEHDSTTAADLGLLTTSPQTQVNGKRILADLNTTLGRGINGGRGIGGDGVLNFTTRSGATFSVNLSQAQREGSLSEVVSAIENAAGNAGKIRVSLNSKGTGFQITDTTTGTGNLIVTGTTGSDTAASLGLSTGPSGVASSTVNGTNLQRKYISLATLLSDLPGPSLGTGQLRITDSTGRVDTVNISSDVRDVGQLLAQINAAGGRAKARINANGDGIEMYEEIPQNATAGTVKIKVEDVNGAVARNLNIAGTAADVGASNTIDGTFERTVTFAATDTLQQVVEKINGGRAGVTAGVISDGTGTTPFRLSLAAANTGTKGRMVIDTGAFDLGLTTLDAGNDARVFFGSGDPARGVAITSSSNTLDTALPGVRIDLRAPDENPVTLTIAKDDDGLVTSVNTFIRSFNTLASRIDALTDYDQDADRRGALLGEGTALDLRTALYATIQGPVLGATGVFDRLSQVGVRIGAGGTLELDEAAFREALARDPASVESLFVAREQTRADEFRDVAPGVRVRNTTASGGFSSLGAMGRMEEFVKRYVDAADGILTRKNSSLGDQIKGQNERITALNLKLENRRLVLERQFLAMERAIGALQTQQSSLASIQRLG